MVTVPDFLKGATILDAHQWVVSNLDGRNEYVLRDMSGMETTLSDLTRGTVTEVNIAPAGVRANPAPSYVFKPEFQPQKRVQQFSSRVMLPDGLSPSVVHALEAKHGGAYRFIASKMLSQRSTSTTTFSTWDTDAKFIHYGRPVCWCKQPGWSTTYAQWYPHGSCNRRQRQTHG